MREKSAAHELLDFKVIHAHRPPGPRLTPKLPANADQPALDSIEAARRTRMPLRRSSVLGRILDLDETAALLGLSAQDMTILARNGRGPKRFITTHGDWYYPESGVLRWIEEGDG